MRILLFQSGLGPSAPAHTWAAALTRAGAECRVVSDAELLSVRSWLQLISAFDIIVITTYHGFDRRQLALMALAAVRKPLVRAWVGSDVLYALQQSWIRKRALLLDRFVMLNLAKGQHLVTELGSIGIESTRAITLIEPPVELVSDIETSLPVSCLVYLPTARREFYGAARVERAIQVSPNVHFIVVGDHEHSLAKYPNVESLGWVSDLEPIWSRVGAVLRLTDHDGVPRMVLEALARGKVVIYAWPLEGCVLADSDGTVDAALAELARGSLRPNRGVASHLFDPKNAWRLRAQVEPILGRRHGCWPAIVTVFRHAVGRFRT